MRRIIYAFAFLTCTLTLFSQAKIEIENLGKKVNSTYDELYPIISPDGRTLFFVRDSHPQNKFGIYGGQDIWYSVKDTAGNWSEAKRFGAPFNTEQYNCVYSVSPDGNTLLIKGAYENGVYTGLGCSYSRKTINGWTLPQKLIIKNYVKMDKGLYSGAFLSNSGKELLLFFSKDKKSENNDIYISFIQPDSSWSEPKSLGNIINSLLNETTGAVVSAKVIFICQNVLITPG
jgi:OOP family OmpA-OmpF porin